MSATAGADERLLLDIPTGTAGCNFDVEVVLHSASSKKDSTVAPSPEWMRTCGAIDDETFDVRRPTDLTTGSGVVMIFLLDSNVCVHWFRKKGNGLVK